MTDTVRTAGAVLLANLVPMIAAAIAVEGRRLNSGCFGIRPGEERIHRAMNVVAYDRFLTLIGWNRVIERRRGFDGTFAGLDGLDQHTRRSEAAHAVCVGVLTIASAAGMLRRRPLFAAGAFGSLVLFHLYPLVLQRHTRARIERIRARAGEVRGLRSSP